MFSITANPISKGTGWLLASPGWAHPSGVFMENPKQDVKDSTRQGSASPLPFLPPATVLAGRINAWPPLMYAKLSWGGEMQRHGNEPSFFTSPFLQSPANSFQLKLLALQRIAVNQLEILS